MSLSRDPSLASRAAVPGVVRVLLVESSDAARRFIGARLAADPQIRVVEAVADARSALAFLQRYAADVVLMDHRLPGLDGFDTTRQIMETHPLPIVLCAEAGASDAVFRSLEAGAVACLAKPVFDEGEGEANAAALANLVQTVKLMSEVKVVRRWAPRHAVRKPLESVEAPTLRAVGIGASTGGPPVLQNLLAQLPANFSLPVLVVQHIARGFLSGMADWLRQTSGLKVQIAAHGLVPQAGHVYLAPDDFHMGLSADGRIALRRPSPDETLCPSVDHLFRSLAEVCGARAIGVLLTGMGRDGAVELKHMKDAGATTLVQDKASSVVYGMPGQAIALGAACRVLPPDQIAQALIGLARAGLPDNNRS